MFKNIFSFDGRIGRLEYAISTIMYLAVLGASQELYHHWGQFNYTHILINIGVRIPIIFFFLSQGSKRCHDIDQSGWLQLIPLYNIWLLIAEGDKHTNTFGASAQKVEEENTDTRGLIK